MKMEQRWVPPRCRQMCERTGVVTERIGENLWGPVGIGEATPGQNGRPTQGAGHIEEQIQTEEHEHGAQDRSEGPWGPSLVMAAVPGPNGSQVGRGAKFAEAVPPPLL